MFDPIPFMCSDGTERIRCWAALDALGALCTGQNIALLEDPELAALFAEHVDSFVAVASAKYDAARIERDGSVFVRVEDLADPGHGRRATGQPAR